MLSEQIRYVDDAISSRHSVRAFLNTPVKNKMCWIFYQLPAVLHQEAIPNLGKSMS